MNRRQTKKYWRKLEIEDALDQIPGSKIFQCPATVRLFFGTDQDQIDWKLNHPMSNKKRRELEKILNE